MRSDGWALIQYDWCSYKKRQFGLRHTHIEERPRKGTVRRLPLASQGDRPRKKSTLPTPWCRMSGSQNCETVNFWCLSPLRCFVMATLGNVHTKSDDYFCQRMLPVRHASSLSEERNSGLLSLSLCYLFLAIF